jgi:hypothetical protein
MCSPFQDLPSAMSLAPLAQSADKQVLFARLGLNNEIHKYLLVRGHLAFKVHSLTSLIGLARGAECEGGFELEPAELDRTVEG